ncbi:MAG: septal ring lytic transglycosylase RlpA family protein [Arcicella sp.]|nr:septal ring lytic transglycosylase RlpA family protein [Arcicella sp.]
MLKRLYFLLVTANLLFITNISAQDFKGKATAYLNEAYGDTTTSGEILNKKTLTASHEYFPLGTVINVVNLKNKKSVQITINDNEISEDDLTLEFTHEVAQILAMKDQDMIDVKISVITWGKTNTNIAENTKKESDFKVDFRKYDYVKPIALKKN